MNKVYGALIFCLLLQRLPAQETFYDYLKPGKYNVGYSDSIIYNPSLTYDEYGYSGPWPLFVKIWFPIEDSGPRSYLRQGEFNLAEVPPELTETYLHLSARMDEAYIRDGIALNLETGDSLDYGGLNCTDVLEMIKKMPSQSTRSKLPPDLDAPIIVYHHGSQGSSLENTLMAEYFASRGYLFVSANFHLPFPNTIYGLLPWSLEGENMHVQSSAKALINFSRTLSPGGQLTFIGHSWGAQEGWCFLHDPKWADAFVSMETTIEYKSDTTLIREMWPDVYEAIKSRKNKFSIPILVLAAEDANLNFDFFKGLNGATLYASYKKPFAHNSYLSMSLMRYFMKPDLTQADTAVLKSQVEGYAAHLELIAAFLENMDQNNWWDVFSDRFNVKRE